MNKLLIISSSKHFKQNQGSHTSFIDLLITLQRGEALYLDSYSKNTPTRAATPSTLLAIRKLKHSKNDDNYREATAEQTPHYLFFQPLQAKLDQSPHSSKSTPRLRTTREATTPQTPPYSSSSKHCQQCPTANKQLGHATTPPQKYF